MFSIASLGLGIICLIVTIKLEISSSKAIKKGGNLLLRLPMKDSAMFTILFFLLSIALKQQSW